MPQGSTEARPRKFTPLIQQLKRARSEATASLTELDLDRKKDRVRLGQQMRNLEIAEGTLRTSLKQSKMLKAIATTRKNIENVRRQLDIKKKGQPT